MFLGETELTVQTLADILVEELHNHLYLKAFNSESRWRQYVPGQHSCMEV